MFIDFAATPSAIATTYDGSKKKGKQVKIAVEEAEVIHLFNLSTKHICAYVVRHLPTIFVGYCCSFAVKHMKMCAKRKPPKIHTFAGGSRLDSSSSKLNSC